MNKTYQPVSNPENPHTTCTDITGGRGGSARNALNREPVSGFVFIDCMILTY